jgi:hypothetical protein
MDATCACRLSSPPRLVRISLADEPDELLEPVDVIAFNVAMASGAQLAVVLTQTIRFER